MKIAVVVSAILFTVLAAVAAPPASAENAERSLYQRPGGEPVMAKVHARLANPAVARTIDVVAGASYKTSINLKPRL